MTGLTAGLILDYEFHHAGKWVATLSTPYLVDAIIDCFNCVPMNNQKEFDRDYNKVDFLISMIPTWSSPIIDWRRRILGMPTRSPKLSYLVHSDPHNALWEENYFLDNKISYLLAFYYNPTLYHLKRIPRNRIIHFPWPIPDKYILTDKIQYKGNLKIACYGAIQGPAYEMRNWCRSFDFVDAKNYSGVENRTLTNQEFLAWLRSQDAVIAAGSDAPFFRLTMPKYFEIPASGALLFAQETDDLDMLGFQDMVNCVIFNRDNFEAKARAYLADPQSYLAIRERGRDLIRTRYALSIRINELVTHVQRHLLLKLKKHI